MSRADELAEYRDAIERQRALIESSRVGSRVWRRAHEDLIWMQGRAAMLATAEGWPA